MTRRGWFVVSAGTALTLLVVGAFCYHQRRDRGPIRYWNFENIQQGMHLTEVEDLLGCVQGDYLPGKQLFHRVTLPDGTRSYLEVPQAVFVAADIMHPEATWHEWRGARGCVSILVDGQGKVIEKEYTEARPMSTGWIRYLEEKLGLGW